MKSDAQAARAVLEHVVGSISPASEAQARGAGQRLRARVGPREGLGALDRLARRLAAARHAPAPRIDRKVIVVCAADHGLADPGVDLGAQAPAIIALCHLAGGEAAVGAAARTAGAPVILIDCGVRGGAHHPLGDGVLAFRLGDGTGDIAAGPAMDVEDALLGIQTGVALVLSLADQGLDVLALGQLAPGGQPSSGAIIAALAPAGGAQDAGTITAALAGDDAPSRPPTAPALDAQDADTITAALARHRPDPARPLEALAALGGYETATMTGMILAAASLHVPVVLDDHGTWAAALVAARLCPAAAGYLIAAHTGSVPACRAALDALELAPLFDLGLAHGEGTGAALALPLLDSAAALLTDPPA